MAESTDTFTTLRPPEEEEVASPAEVREAIETLTDGELIRLERYGRFRVRGLGKKALGRTHEDLLRDALAATLAGDRRWKRRKVDFFTHLVGVMRSLSSHWGERERAVSFVAETEIGQVPAHLPSPYQVVEAQQEIRRIEALFDQDPAVLALIHGLKQGLTGPEIQAAAGLSRKEYESALKRMRRGVARMEETDVRR